MPKRKSRPTTKVAYSDSESEYDDEIQTFHKQQNKILLDSDHEELNSTEEEEVYGLDEESEDEEITQMQQQLRQIKRNKSKKKLDSDLEDNTDDEALPDSRAWGSKKSWFMGGDVRDNKIILSGDEDEAGAAALEEKEMREIEKRQMARMTEEDYLPPSLMMRLEKKEKEKKEKEKKEKEKKEKEKKGKKQNKETGIELTKIKTDLSKLPKEADLERMKAMHPEYVPLWNDFKLKMRELEDKIIPLMGLTKKGRIRGLGATYLQMKFHIICNYLICGGWYVFLLAKKTPRVHHHPVMKRLLELQQFYKRLSTLDKRVEGDLRKILKRLQEDKEVEVEIIVGEDGGPSPMTGTPAAKRRKLQLSHDSEGEDDDIDDEDKQPEVEDGDQERRAITHEMEKNKGLTAHRKKELKNPRVKHRKKYRRALIRRKGQVRDFKPPKTAYSGEMTGIRAGIIRSRKLK